MLGDGDGRFLARLLASNPDVAAEYVDSSARMLELARRRAGESRVVYRRGDVLEFPGRDYDLVVTHFLFDFFEEPEAKRLTCRVAAAAAPGAQWIISEFRHTWWSAPLLWVLYWFFRVTAGLETSRLINHRPILIEHGFHLEHEELAWFGLLASELWVRSSG